MLTRSRWIGVSLALLIALPLSATLRAADPAATPEQPTLDTKNTAAPCTFSFYMENDSEWLKPNGNTDRHYTNGIEIAIGWQPEWATSLAKAIPGGKESSRAAFTLVAGQLIFTPEDLTRSDLIADDHPYAGYLYAGGLLQRRDAAGTSLDEFQLDLGIVGQSSLAEETQIWFHKNIADAQKPQGWANQIKDEGAGQFTFRKKWKFDVVKPAEQESSGFGVDAIPYAGFALGTVKRNIEGGGTLRVGWNLPDDFGPGRLADPGDATAVRSKNNAWSVYGFARLNGRAVEHDTFIGGSDFRSGPGVTEKPLVGELQVGLSAAYHGNGWALELIYSQTHMTKEFEGQDGSDGYGAIAANLTLLF